MYSGYDVRKLFDLYKELSISPKSPEDVYSMYINEYGTYAIKINSYGALSRMIYEIGYMAIDRRLQGKYNHTLITNSASKFERGFLSGLKEFADEKGFSVSPISLYKKDQNSNSFEEIILNGSGNAISIPCN